VNFIYLFGKIAPQVWKNEKIYLSFRIACPLFLRILPLLYSASLRLPPGGTLELPIELLRYRAGVGVRHCLAAELLLRRFFWSFVAWRVRLRLSFTAASTQRHAFSLSFTLAVQRLGL